MIKLIAAYLVFATLTYAINIDQTVLTQITEKMNLLQQSGTGSFILELASIHAELQGPLDDLINTILELENELNADLKELDTNYQRLSNEHTRTVQYLELETGSAEIDVSQSADLISSFLQPTIDSLEARLEQLKSNIKDNRSALERETLQRQNGAKASVERSKNFVDTTAAIDEALLLISQLQNNPSSFAQTGSIEKVIQKIESKIQNKSDTAVMITALLELAQNFSNQENVRKIVQMLNDLRNSTVDSLNTETAEEVAREETFTQRKSVLNAENMEFQRSVMESSAQIDATRSLNNIYTQIAKIGEEKNYFQERKEDLSQFNEQLENENDTFNNESNSYQELRQQLLVDISVAQKAYEFITSAEFSNYILSRVNSNMVKVSL